MNPLGFPAFATAEGNDYMSTHIEYVEFVQPMLNMDQMFAFVWCAQDYLWQHAHEHLKEEEKPVFETFLTKPCGTETIFLLFSCLTPCKTMRYNWFPSLFCHHQAHIEKFLVTQHYYYKDGEIDETESFEEVVPCRGFEMRPYKQICEILLNKIFCNGLFKVMVPYGERQESNRSHNSASSASNPFRAHRCLLNEAPLWFTDGSLAPLPYQEYNAFPLESDCICDVDEFVASYMGEDTLHILRLVHPRNPIFSLEKPQLREYVFNLAYMWMKWIENKKKSQGINIHDPEVRAMIRVMRQKYNQSLTKDMFLVETEQTTPGKRQKKEKKEKD